MQEQGGGRGKRRKLREGILNKNWHSQQRALYHCNNCQKDISHVPRIRCAECKDFDLCLECFSVGVEIKPHKNTHDYQVVENLSFPILHPDWGADEEILLLEAIDVYGLGNWLGVADHVGGGKSAAECKRHYFQTYIDHGQMPLPVPAPEMAQVDMAQCIGRARQGYARQQYRPMQGAALLAAGSNGPAAAAAAAAGAGGASGVLGVDGRMSSEPPGAGAASPSMDVDEPDRPADGAAAAGAGAAGNGDVSAGEEAGPKADGAAGAGGAEAGAGGEAGGSPLANKGLKRHRHEQEAEEQAGPKDAHGPHALVGGRSMHHEGPPAAGGKAAGGKAEAAAGPSERSAPEPSTRGEPAHAKPYNAPGTYDSTGFHAKRMEFDPEYDNDAETIVADMEFNEYDTPADVQMKVQMLQLYNRRLDERERRRSFLLERGLINSRAVQAPEKRRNPAERDLHARMRVFARYQPQAAHEEFVEGLVLEARLRSRIAELREYRRNGIRTFADADTYETEKRRQKAAADAAIAAANAVHGMPYGYGGPGRGAGAAAAKAARAAAAAAAAGMMPPGALMSPTSLQSPPGGVGGGAFTPMGLGAPGTGGPMGMMQAGVTDDPVAAAAAAAAAMGGNPVAAAMAAAANTAGAPSAAAAATSSDPARPLVAVPMGRGTGTALAHWRARRGVPLDVTCLPGVELLSSRERELCAAARLLPAHYLALKDVMLRDAEKNGAISRTEARSFFRLDPSRSLRIYDLLVAAGWVTAAPGPGGKLGAGAGGSGQLRLLAAGGEGEGDDGAGGTEGMDLDDQGGDE
ncbi:hypothetical protein CHLRE_02g089150v5 [Chlamydomonas reinhardtii]|uniref:Transcriptional adapter n=1 Tax=Chlamydomonas reinhardtii TaxID=3055 RepID=A0A2K3E143_CHLRE|nr:uncharacterized protein CHLRE_02g089150v5 [Chlamydomonas reinhardtii]PNW86501.1 hypothetical protein CHLRE_02g089150v5 [Chlamydomonas reinhardtii]